MKQFIIVNNVKIDLSLAEGQIELHHNGVTIAASFNTIVSVLSKEVKNGGATYKEFPSTNTH